MSARKIRAAFAAGSMLATAAVFGAAPVSPVTQDFTVKLKILAECVVGAGTDMTFADSGYLTGTALDAEATFVVGCTKGTKPTITLTSVNAGECTGATRCMQRGTSSDYVNYELYTDSGRSDVWTSETPVTGSGALSSGAPAKDQTVKVYGRVPPQETPAPGDYIDTVTATVSF